MWFRLYTDTRDDPKVQRLPGETFKQWINLLCLTKEGGGLLPPIEDIAFKLRMSDADAQCLVEELVKRGLLDITDEGVMPHNWDSRQFLSDDDPTAALRSRRYRQRNVTRDATGDNTDASRPSEQIQSRAEPDTEQSRAVVASPAKRGSARRTVCDDEFFAELQANPAYSVFDVKAIYHRMVAWCNVKGKQPTRARLVNWLNREDRPMTANGSPPKKPTGNAYVDELIAYVGKPQPNVVTFNDKPVCDADMAEFIDELIEANDFAGIGEQYDLIVKRGGAKAEWEIACVAYYELHKDEPASPEQMAGLNASIRTLARR